MDEGQGIERLVFFSDAVVAIAITLLALPLAEVPQHHPPLSTLLEERAPALRGFAISFVVIARLWWAHHRLFEHVRRRTTALVVLTLAWLFTVVLFPSATALTTSSDSDDAPAAVSIYLGTMLASSALLSAMSLVVLRRPDLTDGHDTAALARAVSAVETTLTFAIAFVLATAVPAVSYWGLLLLAVTGRTDRFIVRWIQRRRDRSVNAG